MRRFLPVMFAVALSLLAQTPVPSPDKKAEEHPASPCRVGGRVVTAAEGSPLKSARVALVPEDSRSDTLIYGATSDSDGHFLLKEVVPGRYRFFATRAGFVDQQYQSQGTDAGAVLALKPGQKISDVLFRMTAAAVITGRVNNEDGEPMIRVQVVALRRPTEEETEEDIPFASRKQTLIPVASSQTDDRGQYRIFGVKPGEYYIRATDSFEPDNNVPFVDEDYWVRQYLGSEYAPVYYPGVVQVGQAQVFLQSRGTRCRLIFLCRAPKLWRSPGRSLPPAGLPKTRWLFSNSPE